MKRIKLQKVFHSKEYDASTDIKIFPTLKKGKRFCWDQE